MQNKIRALGVVLRVALGSLFVFTGSLKILTPIEEFQALTREYHMVPELILPLFTIALPIVEVVVGACLVLGLFERLSAIVIAVMIVMFLIAITQALARGFPLVNCGCFGKFKFGETPSEVLLRDWGLLFVALMLAAHPVKRWALDNIL